MLRRMSAAPDARRESRAGVWAAALLALAFGLALRGPLLSIPFERDEGEYAYIGWRWLEGETPYLQTFNQKPPATFAVYAAFLAIGCESPEAIHAAFAAWIAATQLALFLFARRLAGTEVALGAALLFAVVAANPTLLGNAAQVEAFACLPIVLAAACARAASHRGSALAAAASGAACAVVLLFKPVAAPVAAVTLAWLVAAAQPRARIPLAASALAAGAAVLGAALGYFASQGALGALWDGTVRFNAGYATTRPLAEYPGAFAATIRPTLTSLGPLYAVALLAPLARLATRTLPAIARGSGFVYAWLAAALVASAAGGYFRHHYFLYAAPALALAASAGVADLAGALRFPALARRHAPWVAALAAAALAFAIFPSYHLPGDRDEKARSLYGWNPFPESRALAAWIAERSAPSDALFVFGSEPQIHFLARRPNAGRYILAYHYLFGPPDPLRARQREVLTTLRADPPRFVATVLFPQTLLEQQHTPRLLHAGLDALLRTRYRPVLELRQSPAGGWTADDRPDALAHWRADPRLAAGDRSGWIVLYERADP
jgi:4-amino-4-deoxy-L-arabinose transferase-like glycosyltransferase